MSQLSGHVGAPTVVPPDVFGGVKRVLVPDDATDPQRATVEYENDAVVYFWKLTPTDARTFVTDLDDDSGFGPWVQRIKIQGFDARAHEKLNVPAEWDENGLAKPGTGVETGAASIMWAQGPYVVSVSSPDHTVPQLLEIAQDIRLDHTAE